MDTFLLGIIVALYLVAALYFLKFWRRTHDRLFLAFALAFVIEAINRMRFLYLEHPNEGSPGIYVVRVIAFLIIAIAIALRNLRRQS